MHYTVPTMSDRLRELWNFDDLEATEERLRSQLEFEQTGEGRAEVLTQLARVEGLRGAFDAGERLVLEAEALAGASDVAGARVDLERGRLRRSAGDRDAALPLFESALDRAMDAGAWFIAADAAHMAALAAPDRDGVVAWTVLGIDLAEQHDDAAYWLGPLLNNVGWEYHDAGEYERALDAFERALAARDRDPSNRPAIEIARYAVGKTLRALGRAQEAIPLLEQAVAWAASEGKPDGWFHEELAEEYAAVGRAADAATHARVALPLLEQADPSFAEDAERTARLHRLAGSG
jgi:tetratricopeptide (TPR) repeat protein